jgi:L-proline amide hydrolase
MSVIQIVEGEAELYIPSAGKPCKTWYQVHGDLKSGRTPLVTLHGGPGAAHNHLRPLAELSVLNGTPVIFYDQVGCGKSTHLREKMGDKSFWTVDIFMDELDNLLRHLRIEDRFDLLGQSWGGMLGAEWVAKRQPKGLRKLVIMDSPASIELWVKSANRLRAELPEDVQEALTRNETAGTTNSEEYENAVKVFLGRHYCRIEPKPKDLQDSSAAVVEDPTVYHTMYAIYHCYICTLYIRNATY